MTEKQKSNETGQMQGRGLAFGFCNIQTQQERQDSKTISLDFELLSSFVSL